MPELIAPTARVHASFLAAMAEFRGEGRGGPDDLSMIGDELRTYGDDWHRPEVFGGYLAALHAAPLDEAPRRDGWVPTTTRWWVDGGDYLGRIAIRHRLTPFLREVGGHIGYDIRPSARRDGHATAMLRAALPVARGLGIDPALITCDTTNVASRRVIERNGGRLEDERRGKFRFWVRTLDM